MGLDNVFFIHSDSTMTGVVETTSCPDGLTVTECNLDCKSKLEDHVKNITQWHYDRNLIHGSSDKDQFCKLVQEVGELSDSICKNQNPADDIGDIIVVLINIAERNKLTLDKCLEKAWLDIKDRKGRMVDGVFVKETI